MGSHLLLQLTSSGYNPRAIYRDKSKIDDLRRLFRFYNPHPESLMERIEWVHADLEDYFALEDALLGIKQVYHAAAMVSFNPGEARKMLKTNAEGTANLMNACIQRKVEKICHVSSISSLGKQIDGEHIDEQVEWQLDDHRSAYSYSKFRAEMEVWRASKEGIPVVIVNPSVVIGPVNWLRSSGKLFYSIKRGMPFYTKGTTGFVDVRDVAKAIVMVMESDSVNERFILNSENLSFKDFFTMVAKEMGETPPFIKASRLMTEAGWRVNLLLCLVAGKTPALTKDTARTAHALSTYSAMKFSKKFDYEFIPVNKAIENAAKWFKTI